MQTRRDLLKYFGIGTVITTASGEGPIAKLIEVPRVELLEPKIARVVDLSKIKSVTVNIEALDGTVHSFRDTQGGYSYGEGKICSADRLLFDIEFSKVDSGYSPQISHRQGRIRGEGGL